MIGPVATLGSIHACPVCIGAPPHLSGAITVSGAPAVLVNNKPIALMGDPCLCPTSPIPHMVVQGNPGVTVNGIPVATVGCLTAHGGVVAKGELGVTITSNVPNPTVTMPVEDIPFPKINFKNKVRSSISGTTAALKDAEKKIQEIKDKSREEEAEEEERKVSIESTYPLDELVEFSNQFGAAFFSYGMQAIFGESKKGEDVPLHAFDYLYKDLSDGKVKMPTIKVQKKSIPKARYKKEDNTIYISQKTIIEATENNNVEAMGELYQILMEEFGHYIDWQLRSYYTTLGGDAPLDEGAVFGYCLTTFNIFEEDEIVFGEVTVDGTNYTLKINLEEIHSQIDDLVTKERIRLDEQGPTGEHFSAGIKTFKEAGGYTHFGIENILVEEKIFENQDELKYLYLGNLLRDWSQLITPTTERYTEEQRNEIVSGLGLTKKEEEAFFGSLFHNNIRLSRKHLSFVIELIAAHELIGADVSKSSGIGSGKGDGAVKFPSVKEKASNVVNIKGVIADKIKGKGIELGLSYLEYSVEYYLFKKWYPNLTVDTIGVYKPEEHIDNPVGAAVVDTERKHYMYCLPSVDPKMNTHFGMKNYIRCYESNTEQPFVIQEDIKTYGQYLPTAATYLTSQLEKSFSIKNKEESLLYFGNAMHTLEDYFAHSNFVELSLIKVGYHVEPWVDVDDAKVKAFKKEKRTVKKFDSRDIFEDYFDRNTHIKTYNRLEELEKEYPEAKYSATIGAGSFSFAKGEQQYEYHYIKGANSKQTIELHLTPAVHVLSDENNARINIDKLPIVTGMFSSLDMIHSLSHKLQDMFKHDSFSWKDSISSEWEGKPIIKVIDLIILAILTDLKYAQNAEHKADPKYKGSTYAKIIEHYEKVIVFRGVVLGVLEKLKKGKGIAAVGAWLLITILNSLEKVFKNVVNMVIRFIIHGLAVGIREHQNMGKIGSNPTHSQLAKDDMAHPLHPLAGELARAAVADIGMHYLKARKGKIDAGSVLDLAREYLSHPKDVDWMDVKVAKWASTHLGDVNKAKNKGVLDKLHHHHHHHMENLHETGEDLLEKIDEELEELNEFYEKAKDRLDDVNIGKYKQRAIKKVRKFLKK